MNYPSTSSASSKEPEEANIGLERDEESEPISTCKRAAENREFF